MNRRSEGRALGAGALLAAAALLAAPGACARAEGPAAAPPAPASPTPAPSAPAPSAPAPSAPASPVPAPAAVAAPRRVTAFFSGHSLIDNPMPDWVELIAASRGDSLGWQEQIVLGSPIRVRTKGEDPKGSGYPGYRLGKSKDGGQADVLRELASPGALGPGEKYGTLVITERTDLLGTIQWENTVAHLRHFHERLVEQNPSGRTLLTQVWPEIDRAQPAAWLAYVEDEIHLWQCVATRASQGLGAGGGSIQVVPAGLALAELVKSALTGGVPGVAGAPGQRLDAIFSDDVHLTWPGIYLMSAVHYAALFNKSPLGAAGPSEVRPELLPLLQRIAWDVVTRYRANARPLGVQQCGARIASDICPAYYRLRGRPEDIKRCKDWSGPDSPLAGARSAEQEPSRVGALLGWGSGVAALLVGGAGYLLKRRRTSSGAETGSSSRGG